MSVLSASYAPVPFSCSRRGTPHPVPSPWVSTLWGQLRLDRGARILKNHCCPLVTLCCFRGHGVMPASPSSPTLSVPSPAPSSPSRQYVPPELSNNCSDHQWPQCIAHRSKGRSAGVRRAWLRVTVRRPLPSFPGDGSVPSASPQPAQGSFLCRPVPAPRPLAGALPADLGILRWTFEDP